MPGGCLYSSGTKIVLSLCLSILLFSVAWAQKDYQTTYRFTCGPTQLMVTNTCTMLDEYEPFCSRQKLEFFNTKTGKKVEQVYLPKPFRYGEPAFVAGLSCLKNKKLYYITTYSVNYGNCSTCEWSEVFNSNGEYIGSTRRGFTHALSRSFKLLPDDFFYVFDDKKIVDRIVVYRVP